MLLRGMIDENSMIQIPIVRARMETNSKEMARYRRVEVESVAGRGGGVPRAE